MVLFFTLYEYNCCSLRGCLISSQSHTKCVVNVQVGGGPTATMFSKRK